MPVTYRIDTVRNVIVFEARGTVADDDLTGAYRVAYDDPAFRPGMSELVDFRGVERLKLTSGGIRRLIDVTEAAGLGDVPFRAAVVTPSAAMTGMVRMYALLRDGAPEQTRTFETLDEARAWLGLESG